MNIDIHKINPSELPSVPLSQKSRLPSEPCIYFAIDGHGVIQYIGRSANPRQRWSSHHRYEQLSRLKKVRIAYLAVEADLLPQVEAALIKGLRPALNRTHLEFLYVEMLSSDFHRKWGKLWAFAKNRPITRLMRDVFEDEVEKNLPEIKRMVRDIAIRRGISYEDLIEEILNCDAPHLEITNGLENDRKAEVLKILGAMSPEQIEEAIALLRQFKN